MSPETAQHLRAERRRRLQAQPVHPSPAVVRYWCDRWEDPTTGELRELLPVAALFPMKGA